MKKKLSEGRESKRQALLRKKKEEPAAFWTYVVLRFIVILSVLTVVFSVLYKWMPAKKVC